MTINESLEHPLFNKIRNKKLEIECKQPVVLEFEKSLNEELTQEKLRVLFLEEIKYYNKK